MTRNNGYFEFSVENSCEKGIYTTEQHGGIGMNNVKRRLELLYPGTHQLTIDDNAETFKINLKLKI
jgi:LytS/YehU family sensor histidine kinase